MNYNELSDLQQTVALKLLKLSNAYAEIRFTDKYEEKDKLSSEMRRLELEYNEVSKAKMQAYLREGRQDSAVTQCPYNEYSPKVQAQYDQHIKGLSRFITRAWGKYWEDEKAI